jgi:hypothetical protein
MLSVEQKREAFFRLSPLHEDIKRALKPSEIKRAGVIL